MNSVVMISYFFPPDGSAGVYRPLRFVRHLPSFGWRGVVVTDDPAYCLRYDPELLEQVPPSTEIMRVRNPDPWLAFQRARDRQFYKSNTGTTAEALERIQQTERGLIRSAARQAIRWVESIAYHPDSAMCWIGRATKATTEACARSGAKIVWATGGPWSSFVVARNNWRRTGVPYILDFRDSWTLLEDPERNVKDWVRARQHRLLNQLFRDAHRVVFRYMSEAEAYWRTYPRALDPERIHVIPNGYEGSIAKFEASPGNRCTVLYTGTIHFYSYANVLCALRLLKDSNSDLARKLRVVFVGDATEDLARTATQLDLSDLVEVFGSVSFSEVGRLQKEAHALLLLGWKQFPGHELGGSKIFGYFKAGRPIIGALADDENKRMLRSAGVKTIANIESVSEIAKAFLAILDAWSTGSLPSLLPDPAVCQKYSADNQTRLLARALEGLPAEEPFRPGENLPPPSLFKQTIEERWQPAPDNPSKLSSASGERAMAEAKKETAR
jgi:glycosyltransferase involved in cell wall biosynthesis